MSAASNAPKTVEEAAEEVLFTPDLIAVLAAIADTFIAPLSSQETSDFVTEYTSKVNGPSPASASALTAYAVLRASDLDVAGYLASTLPLSTPKKVLKDLLFILWLLTTRRGTWVLCGGPSTLFPKSFIEMSTEERTAALLTLSNSSLLPLRVLFTTFKGIVSRVVYGKRIPDGEGKLANPTHPAIGYPGPVTEKQRAVAGDVWMPEFLDVETLARSRGISKDVPVELEVDVVVIGSGAGGGVVAGELATAGHSVLVLEKGTFTHAPDLPLTELESMSTLYESKGLLQSDNGSIFVFAGSTFGGGTFVNWSGSLRAPHSVRAEWAEKYQLPHFVSRAYGRSLDKIEARLGISKDRIKHNEPNSVLIDGCKKLGYPVDAIPQNTGTHEHSCGFCGLGCPYGEKQGTSVSYLRDAANHGAKFIQGCFVDKVIHHDGVAVGVKAKVGPTRQPLTVRARRVVCSAGSLSTPSILRRSGLCNPNIGKHLHLHPVGLVLGIFPDRLIQPYKGSIMTTVSNAVADLSGTGYGARLEIPFMHPSLYSMVLPWRSAKDHKRLMTFFDRIVPIIVLLRDEVSEGDVWQDDENNVRVNYDIKELDLDRIVTGMQAATKVLIAAGASEIFTGQQHLPSLQVDSKAEEPFASEEYKTWIAEMKRQKWHIPLFCAHQMGTCRMSGDVKVGACNPEGETWEVKNLWVADTSLFPTASGVNPMLTTFSVADTVAQNLKKSLEREAKVVKEE
ncbi:hypothetical protein HDV00_004301 [Rhizophlyctis rosea]|nr:hypothetical protein HDV00_004301 [Rhizophlyctis rosea]